MKDPNFLPFKRNRYYYGKLLRADDLELEQSYINDKRRFTNRLLHGTGVIFGLSVIAADDTAIAVQPGAALDFCGREIVMERPFLAAVSSVDGYRAEYDNSVCYLCAEYCENEIASERGEYEYVKESCHLYLTGNMPYSHENTVKRFFRRTERVYKDASYSVFQTFPAIIGEGTDVVLEIKIKRTADIETVCFSYSVKLTGLKYNGGSELTVSYDSRVTPFEDDEYTLAFTLSVMTGIRGEEAVIEAGGIDPRHNGAVMRAEIVSGSYPQRVLEKFRNDGMELIRNDISEKTSIYLAQIHMRDGRIDRVKRMPLEQYVFSPMNGELLRLVEKESSGKDGTVLSSVSAELPRADGKFSAASGIAEIDMPIGGRRGECFFSAPIAHGLGAGQAEITLGLVTPSTETVFGSDGIFDEKNLIRGELAARLSPKKGEFVIGLRLTDSASASKVLVHWTVLRTNTSDAALSEPAIFIEPGISELRVMKTIQFEARFENVLPQPLRWYIHEGARGGSVTGGGFYTAPNSPGVYRVVAETLSEPPLKASAFVVVRE